MAEGCDVSEHQGVLSGDWFAQFEYSILRAFNEWGNRDRVIDATWHTAAGRTRRGVYGWPIPGHDNRALGRQLVEAFPGAEACYWADREHSNAGLASEWDVEEYLRGIEDAGGRAGFYSNIPECPRTSFLDGHMWWMADYTYNNGQRQDPHMMAPRPNRDYTIHQYSSAGGLDRNWSDNLDWTGYAPPAPAPEPEPVWEDEMSFTATDEQNQTWLFGGSWRTALSDWEQVNALQGLAQPVPYNGMISNFCRDAYRDTNILPAPPAGGVPPADIAAISDTELTAEVNRRIAAGALATGGATVVDV
jgi:hypothetical protein